jgi:RHS repeat-associated protein
MNVASQSGSRPVGSLWIVGIGVMALAGAVRAQGCAQQQSMPNECCPPLAADCLADPPSEGRTSIGDPEKGDPERFAVRIPSVSTYGTVTASLPMSMEGTGLHGLAKLYPSLFMVDMSLPWWTQSGINLKTEPMANDQEELDPIPVPDMSGAALDEDSAVQPRPGTMPGLYLLQVGNEFFQYGEPVDSGANPQSTAIYSQVASVGGPPSDFQLYRNQLSGAELAFYTGPNFVEVRHHDGTVARFDFFNPYKSSYNPTPARKMWRLTNLRDPYDSVATFTYNGQHWLTQITFPSQLRRIFDYAPQWPGYQGSGLNLLEIRHEVVGVSPQPPEVAARRWGMVFQPSGPLVGPWFGSRLYRTFSAVTDILQEQSAPGVYNLTPTSEIQGQVVREFVYDSTTGSSSVLMKHFVHTGTAFDNTLATQPSVLVDLHETRFGSNQRVSAQTTSLLNRTIEFSYPVPTRTAELLPNTHLGAIEVLSRVGTVAETARRVEFDRSSGRVYTVRTTPSNTFLGRPRANDSTANAPISIPSNVPSAEPDWIEVYNVYDQGCSCNKPVERRERSSRSGIVSERNSLYTYDPITKLVTLHRELNPESSPAGPGPHYVDWSYTYEQAKTATQDWGGWRLLTEVTPDGTWSYSYSAILNRELSARHGQIAGTMTRTINNVRLQTGLSTTGSTTIQEIVHLNLPNNPGGFAYIGGPAGQQRVMGQPRVTYDGDGIATIYTYSTRGFLNARTEADRQLGIVTNAMGETTETIANVGTAKTVSTVYVLMPGSGEPKSATSTSPGAVARQTQWFYDRFGNVKVQREWIRDSQNAKASKHVGTGNGRDWVESQWHYDLHRLAATYVDRKPIDEASGGTQFLETRREYLSDGRLARVFHPNGSSTNYDFDGFGTLYRTRRFHPTSTAQVNGPKSFVNAFLEVVGSYEFDGTSHLWTEVTRNAAGAVAEVKEPMTVAPAGYTASTGGARHVYELDKLGRVVKLESVGGTTVLVRQRFDYDQLDRTIRQRDDVLGFGSGEQATAWEYAPQKASQLKSVWRTGLGTATVPYRAQVYGTTGLLSRVTDAAGNFVDYTYLSQTQFVTQVKRSDVDPIVGRRITATNYVPNGYGEITQVDEGTWATAVDANPAPSAPAITHYYFYNSLGRVDRYQDPKARLQKFLTDALGRVVEHVRVGDNGDYIWNGSIYKDSGESDGRTLATRIDDLGENSTTQHATITHRDFAGRPFVLQNPGGLVAPTPSAKHQKMSLFAEYDGASRLKALYDGDFGTTEFFRDGPGRVIVRQLLNSSSSQPNGSVNRISQYNTRDVIERDAIGRIAGTEYWGTETGGFKYGEEEFQQDSLGRMHSERFLSAFTPNHWLINNSTYVGGNPYRSGLAYTDTLNGTPSGFEKANLSMTHDSIGRLTEIGWDRAPSGGGAMATLAKYDYAGGMRRQREVRYGTSATGPRSHTEFRYDRFDRLLRIQDTVHPTSGAAYTASQFDYEYDEVHNLTKERYAKVGGAVGDRFTYDAYHRLHTAKMGCNAAAMDDLTGPTVHETLTYGLDGVNNRATVTSQKSAGTSTETYGLQGGSHPQGASNRYDSLAYSGTSTTTFLKYDDRGNLIFDGKFQYRYDYLNRLQEVWKVATQQPVNEDAMFAEVQSGSMDDAEESVKLEVPDVHTRVFREHTDPVFRNRLRATIVGGVITVTPSSQGGGGRPGFLPNDAYLTLAAVYVYDAFNRRVAAALVDPSVGETQFHVWDGWRQVAQHRLETGTWQAPPMKQFAWGSGFDELVSYRRNLEPTWETFFILLGGQETSVGLVNGSGSIVERYEFDPYGKVDVYPTSGIPASGPSSVGLPFLWKAIRCDEITHLLQMRHRHYSADIGRFLTPDPLGDWHDEPGGGNGYQYAWDNPLIDSDPFGLQVTRPTPQGLSASDQLRDAGSELLKALSGFGKNVLKDARSLAKNYVDARERGKRLKDKIRRRIKQILYIPCFLLDALCEAVKRPPKPRDPSGGFPLPEGWTQLNMRTAYLAPDLKISLVAFPITERSFGTLHLGVDFGFREDFSRGLGTLGDALGGDLGGVTFSIGGSITW